jgi:DNA-binding SARP family transcriptional activator/TolB-like protein
VTAGAASSPPRAELFGAPRIRREGGAAPLRPGRKPVALLAYLVVHEGRALSRETLAALLWPERFEEQARQSLRQALAALRKALGPQEQAIVGTSDGLIRFDATALGSDLADFERLARSTAIEDLSAAAALYQGDFLAELGSVSDGFDAWAGHERERLRALAVQTVEQLAEALKSSGRTAEALAQAQRLVAIDPAHEAGHRRLMSLLAASGQRAAALRQYDECRAALARHLDVEPSEETAALHRAIRDAATADAPSRADGAAIGPASPMRKPLPTRFVRLALRHRLLAGAGVAALLAALVLLPRPAPPGATAASASADACLGGASAQPTLIVMPLRTFGDDPDLERFAAATTEGVQNASSLVPGVDIVIGPPADHPDLELAPTGIAEKTGASHVLDGSVRRRGDALQASLRLVDGRTGRQLWQSTTRLDAGADDLTVQDEIALAAAAGVQERLADGQQAAAYRRYGSGSLQVWEHNTRGYGHINRTDPLSSERAREEFESALAIEPEDAGARTGLAFVHLSALLFGWSKDAAADRAAARAHADAALASDPEHPPALSARAILALLEGDHSGAVALGEDALRLTGGGGDAAAVLAYVLSYTGDSQRSVELARRALRSRPYAHPLWYEWTLARGLRLSGDPEAAVACLSRTDGGGVAPGAELILSHAAAGDLDAARAVATLMQAQVGGAFSSAAYCGAPPSSDPGAAEHCVAVLTAAGLPP